MELACDFVKRRKRGLGYPGRGIELPGSCTQASWAKTQGQCLIHIWSNTSNRWRVEDEHTHTRRDNKEFTCICTFKWCLKSPTGLQHDWHASTALPATSESHLRDEEKYKSRNATAISLLFWAATFGVSKELLESQLINGSEDRNPLPLS